MSDVAREKEGFRECMALLNERFPDKDMLSTNEVMQFCGMSWKTVRAHIRFNELTGKITKSDLARQVCV